LKITLTILALFVIFQSSSQNLVPNPSFEDTIMCPSDFSQIQFSTGWTTYSESPDYFNSCDPSNSNFGVPNNYAGYQMPYDGNAYAGAIVYRNGGISDVREVIGRELATPLTIGVEYFISFKVNLSLDDTYDYYYAIGGLGVLFSTVNYTPSVTVAPINNLPHVYFPGIISDTSDWTTIEGSFVADSTYNYIMLGNFFDDQNTDSLLLGSTPFGSYAYYYFDDICVSTAIETCIPSMGLIALPQSKKNLIKIVNLLGQEIEDKPNTLMIYIYSDGTTQKIFRME